MSLNILSILYSQVIKEMCAVSQSSSLETNCICPILNHRIFDNILHTTQPYQVTFFTVMQDEKVQVSRYSVMRGLTMQGFSVQHTSFLNEFYRRQVDRDRVTNCKMFNLAERQV